jgi:hypothetical protein
MISLRTETKSKTVSFRLPKSIFAFLSQKAIVDGQLNEKNEPVIAPYISEKLYQVYEAGWDAELLPHNEAINVKTKSEVINELGDVYNKALRYDALCEIISNVSHNGIEYYQNQINKKLKR